MGLCNKLDRLRNPRVEALRFGPNADGRHKKARPANDGGPRSELRDDDYFFAIATAAGAGAQTRPVRSVLRRPRSLIVRV